MSSVITPCLRRRDLIGERVLVLDDLHSWRGIGTALYLAEAGHKVTVMTANRVLAAELSGTGADAWRAPALPATVALR